MNKTEQKEPMEKKNSPAESGMPKKVEDLAEMARKGAAHVTGVDPDYTYLTLPLIDQYLKELPSDATQEVVQLVLTSAGCYFGEVVRRLLNGRWAVEAAATEAWRIELASCFLYFHPVGLAGEVYSRGADEDYDGSFGTLDKLNEPLSEMLAAAAPYSEDEYYSLAGRVDVLQMAADWLTALPMATGKRARIFTADDYREYLNQE